MRISVAAVGKMRAGAEADLIEEYAKRARGLGRSIGLSGPEFSEYDAPRGLSGAKRQAKEGELLSATLASGGYVVCLDERGENLSSERFAKKIGAHRDDGTPSIHFLIGGADGHGAALREKSDMLLSFGVMTWPHLLARAMLAEQLYRAMTILSGHPYHRS